MRRQDKTTHKKRLNTATTIDVYTDECLIEAVKRYMELIQTSTKRFVFLNI